MRTLVFLVSIFMSINLFAQVNSNTIVGIWEMDDKTAKMEVYKVGDEYRAKLLWGEDIVNEDGSSKQDVNNPDENLRNKDLVGAEYLTGLKFEDDEWEDGKVYNNGNGKWYNCYVWMKKGVLNLRGYLGLPMFGQTTEWNRVK